MQEQIINYETAVLAKEVGFSFTSNNQVYNDSKVLCGNVYKNKVLDEDIPAPTQSLLHKWIRETYPIDIVVESYLQEDGKRTYDWTINSDLFLDSELNEEQIKENVSYEQAYEIGLVNALRLIKRVQNESKQ